MKVAELRKLIADHEAAALRTLVVELYKMIPAKVRDERDVDALVREPGKAAALRKAQRARSAMPDPDEALDEAQLFLENAAQQNYFAPNRAVPKKERAGWRFVARRVYKNLVALLAVDALREESGELLAELYRILCRGEEVYLFPSTEPFEAMKVERTEMLGAALAAARATRPADRFIDLALDLALGGSLWGMQSQVARVVAAEARTPELRDLLVERVRERCRPPSGGARSKGQMKLPAEGWKRASALKVLATIALYACAANGETERGVEEFQAVIGERGSIEATPGLLAHLQELGRDDLWAATYDRAVEQGLDPSSTLVQYRESLET